MLYLRHQRILRRRLCWHLLFTKRVPLEQHATQLEFTIVDDHPKTRNETRDRDELTRDQAAARRIQKRGNS